MNNNNENNNNYYCEVSCEGSMALPCGDCARSRYDGIEGFREILDAYESGQIPLEQFFVQTGNLPANDHAIAFDNAHNYANANDNDNANANDNVGNG